MDDVNKNKKPALNVSFLLNHDRTIGAFGSRCRASSELK
jgi:hypothetical protein